MSSASLRPSPPAMHHRTPSPRCGCVRRLGTLQARRRTATGARFVCATNTDRKSHCPMQNAQIMCWPMLNAHPTPLFTLGSNKQGNSREMQNAPPRTKRSARPVPLQAGT
eukprot:6806324-Prymnesium_polylepis.1